MSPPPTHIYYISVIVRNLAAFSSIQTAWIKLSLPEINLCRAIYRSVALLVMVGKLRVVKDMGGGHLLFITSKRIYCMCVFKPERKEDSIATNQQKRGWFVDTRWERCHDHDGKEWRGKSCIQIHISTNRKAYNCAVLPKNIFIWNCLSTTA